MSETVYLFLDWEEYKVHVKVYRKDSKALIKDVEKELIGLCEGEKICGELTILAQFYKLTDEDLSILNNIVKNCECQRDGGKKHSKKTERIIERIAIDGIQDQIEKKQLSFDDVVSLLIKLNQFQVDRSFKDTWSIPDLQVARFQIKEIL